MSFIQDRLEFFKMLFSFVNGGKSLVTARAGMEHPSERV